MFSSLTTDSRSVAASNGAVTEIGPRNRRPLPGSWAVPPYYPESLKIEYFCKTGQGNPQGNPGSFGPKSA